MQMCFCTLLVPISSTPPSEGVLRTRRKDAGARCSGGGEDKDAQKKAGITCWCGGARSLWAQKKGRGKMLMQRDNIFVA